MRIPSISAREQSSQSNKALWVTLISMLLLVDKLPMSVTVNSKLYFPATFGKSTAVIKALLSTISTVAGPSVCCHEILLISLLTSVAVALNVKLAKRLIKRDVKIVKENDDRMSQKTQTFLKGHPQFGQE